MTQEQQIKRQLEFLNMRTLATLAGMKYDALRSFNCGRRKLSDEETRAIKLAIRRIAEGAI